MDDKQLQSTIDSMKIKSLELINSDVNQAADIKAQLDSLIPVIQQMESGKIAFDPQIIKNYYFLSGSFLKAINGILSHLPSPQLLQE
jgi:hypothetical protein